jgi:hypothetical protein
MGQITIEIPSRKTRRYLVTDVKAAEELISTLDRTAVQVKNGKPSAEELEEQQDAADVRRAIEEYRRVGKTYSWEGVKKELGL